jgi:2-polyprenyl-3-methyl-5-hydroxy-6-metoxy-1,4-benzoquinol methylase
VEETYRVSTLANWYLREQLDFDKRLIRFRYLTLKKHFQGPEALELGPAEGEMTQFLVNDFEQLTVVEGSAELLQRIPSQSNLIKIHSLFEDFKPKIKYNTIIMEHILEHVEQPVMLLMRVKDWLKPGGKILIGVPNGNSIHRLAAVKMGVLKESCELNERDHALGHRRVYTQDTLRMDVLAARLQLLEMGGVFFKPLSNMQIQDHWNEEMIEGFFLLGNDFPENAAELYAVCTSS